MLDIVPQHVYTSLVTKKSNTLSEPQIPTPSEFWKWAKNIPVASRDTGFAPITPWGTQTRLIEQILTGLREGVHQYLVTKAGQIGATQALVLLGAYWMTHFPGTQGALVANEDDVTNFNRDNLSGIIKVDPKPCEIRVNNKSMLALANGSRLLFHTAGPRSGHRLSVGRGFNYAHGTELALWQNPAALTIMRTRFSDSHPYRLAVFETTPRGFNWWKDVWDEAEDAIDIRRIDLLWWMREDYQLDKSSEAFKRYWNGQLRPKERRWARELERRYDTTLTPEQLAWRRWYEAEKAGGDSRLADQEMATLIEDGFNATGISFLSYDSIRRCRRTVSTAPTPDRWRYEFGANIEDTKLRKTIPEHQQLIVWEEPKPIDGYVVAGVPAYSANPECADYVTTVWHATRDALEQVAEFSEEELGMQEFSWCCAHLVGTFQAPRKAFILEVSGIGSGVLQELKRLQNSGWGTSVKPRLSEVVGGIRHYLWRRPDTLAGGAALQWKSSPELQNILLNRFRDQISSGRVTVRSPAMLAEIERTRQDGENFKPEGRQPANHRLISGALAVECWSAQLVPLFQRVQGTSTATSVTGRMVGDFFGRLRGKGPVKTVMG
jgi:hypothetical protein